MKKNALVFGISGEQGRCVASGLLASCSYDCVYGVTRDITKHHVEVIAKSVPVKANEEALSKSVNDASVNVTKHFAILEADLNNAASLRQMFVRTRATDIFLVTTTYVPIEGASMGSLRECEELEYESIKSFFDVLVDVHKNESSAEDGTEVLERHVIFSTLDNVRGLIGQLKRHNEVNTNLSTEEIGDLVNMKPLDDGGIVPNYSGKGRGGEYALALIHGMISPWKNEPVPWMDATTPTPSIIPGLTVTLITLPFLHCNFALSAAPLPTTSEGRALQWSIPACLGDASQPIDMISASDLKYIVPVLFRQRERYQGRVIKLSGEKITMDEVAYQFSELFGKDVIYSPLTLDEMNMLDIPEAPAFAQMCHYLASEYADHNVEETKSILKVCGREPQSFEDWLLSHSDEEAFEKVGLTLDAKSIQCVAVFDATSKQGELVIRGLLSDTRNEYAINACICTSDAQDDVNEAKANEIESLDPRRVTVHYANLGDLDSCRRALEGAEGAFLVTDFFPAVPQLSRDPEKEDQEERLARVVIDACAASGSVRHLVLSTMEHACDVDNELKESGDGSKPLFDVKARVAAYARAKRISMTYLLMPVYSEHFFRALAGKIRNRKADEDKGNTLSNEREEYTGISEDKEEKGVCMSAEMLGPTVARVFDSYEVYAGHEIGLMTDVLSFEEAAEIANQVFFDSTPSEARDRCVETPTSYSECRFGIVAKDLGQMFRCYSKTEAVKHRASIARSLELVPDAKQFKKWLEENRDNADFRQMLGLR